MNFDTNLIRKIIRLAIEEDLPAGDLTSELTLPANHSSSALVVAREPLIVCGLPLLEVIFREFNSSVAVEIFQSEGASVACGTSLCSISGPTRQILKAERIVLNFLQRLSGIASYSNQIVAEARKFKLTILDTRKTTPGLRLLEKYACSIGGVKNHRRNLSEMILVKDNHIDGAGGVDAAMKRVAESKPFYTPVEVEVRDFEELRQALAYKPQVVMLDNMSDQEIKRSLSFLHEHHPDIAHEVSGGVNKERFKALSALGVTHVSIGALTTRAPNADIALDISLAQS
jgi:nicotinate-nucleotide pyrophosphorylase (carboxylating)